MEIAESVCVLVPNVLHLQTVYHNLLSRFFVVLLAFVVLSLVL